jgi:hypothetical protein
MSQPSWHQWISYETGNLKKEAIIKFITDSIEHSINMNKRYQLFDRSSANIEHLRLNVSKLAITVVDNAMKLQDESEKTKKLKEFRDFIDNELPLILISRALKD